MMKWGCTLTLLHLLILSASATDTLRQGESIDGESLVALVSSNHMFALGIFTPGNSGNSYAGIWYHNISVRTVVWVANRERFADQLTFTSDGNLAVVDDLTGAFSVFTYGSGITNRTTATLLDNGNLVLRDARNQILWQSFDNPTDHLLPGMLLGWDGLQNRVLTSWKSSDDPSSGEYSFGARPTLDKEFFTWVQQDLSLHMEWSTGSWDGSKFSNIPSQMNLYFKHVSTGGVNYLSFVNPGGTEHSQRTRAVISENGQFSILIWDSKSQEWNLLFSEPRGGCDVVNICGPNTVCSVIDGKPSCACLRGFQAVSLTNWSTGVRGDGCIRKTSLQCKTDVFLPLPHVKSGSYDESGIGKTATQCESDCFDACTCTAYAYGWDFDSRNVCMSWSGDISTLQQLDDDGGANHITTTIYVRLAASELSSNLSASTAVFNNNNKKKLKIVISLTVVFVAICCVLVGSFLWWRRQKGKEKLSQEQSILLLGAEIAKELGQNGKRAPDFTLFDFSQISNATNGFSNENKLGEGGYGPVYKGILTEGQEIAVKRLSTRSGQGLEEFKNEILLIAKLQHSNLVRLLGCCIQKEEKILIYEYMHNKSLDFFIFDKERGPQLYWSRRRHIVEGIAQGIIYLHKHSRLRIIHRDLKASNVLLDAEMNPKISDFGMARIFNPNEAVTNTIRVVGTYGYISPEYANEGKFSIKSDVFSFGVLLLEIVSGKRNTSFHQYKNALNLVGYAWELWLEAKLSDLADPSLGDICPLNDITRCIHVALLCVQEKAIDRPTMTEVITMLSSETASLVDPRQPAFVTMSVPRETDLPRKTSSINNVTITSIDGR